MRKLRLFSGDKESLRPRPSAASLALAHAQGPSLLTIPNNASATTLSTTSSQATGLWPAEQSRPGPPWTHSYAVTRDGSQLSYYSIPCLAQLTDPDAPRAPSLLISHGLVSYAMTHQDLAAYLSQHYTCHTASRRGRGFSDPWPEHVTSRLRFVEDEKLRRGSALFPRVYSSDFTRTVVEQEIDDLEALLAATGADIFFGVSTSATVALLALMAGPSRAPRTCALRKLLLYEPLLSFTDRDHGPDLGLVERYEKEMAVGRVVDAVCTGLAYMGMVPKRLPRIIARALAGVYMRSQVRNTAKGKGSRAGHGNGTVTGLAPSLRYDFAIATEALMESARWARIHKASGPAVWRRRAVKVRITPPDVIHDRRDDGINDTRHHHPQGARIRKAADADKDDDDDDADWWNERIALISSEKGSQFLRQTTEALATVLPGAVKRVLTGWGHEVLCNETEVGGSPAVMVPVVHALAPPGMFARGRTEEGEGEEA